MGISSDDNGPRARHLLFGAALLLLVGCESPLEPLDEDLFPIASASDGEITLELLGRGSSGLKVGRNTIALRLSEEASGAAIFAASITQAWVMVMAGERHGCPAKDPIGEVDDSGVFPATVVLPMASGEAGSWSSLVTVRPPGGGEHALRLPDLAVADSAAATTLLADDGANYLVSLSWADASGPALEPVVGQNPFVITVHSQVGDAEFRPVEDLAIAVTADMPAMGHGSSGNTDPSYLDHGEYLGQANLSMPGAWQLTFALSRAGAPLGVLSFEVRL